MKIRRSFVEIIIIFLLLLPSQFLMLKTAGMYPSHDGLLHVDRLQQYKTALQSWQIPPRLTPILDNQLGYPMFVANYHLPYILSTPFLLLTNNPTLAFKAVLSISFLLSGLFAYLFLKQISSTAAALAGTIIYTYSPYRFANIYTRAAFGESVALMFVPLCFLFIEKIATGKNRQTTNIYTICLALSLFGLTTAHTLILLIFLPLILVYSVFKFKTSKTWLALFCAIVLGLLASSFQLLPVLFEKKYLMLEQSFFNVYNFHLLDIRQILRIPGQNINIGTTYQLGVVNSLVLIISLCTIKVFRNKTLIFAFLALAITTLFLITKNSSAVWDSISFFHVIIYPWRLFSVPILISAIICSLLIDKLPYKRVFTLAIIALSIFTSRHYFLKPTQIESTKPGYYWTAPSEFFTIWSTESTFKPRPFLSSSNNANFQIIYNSPYKIMINTQSKQTAELTIAKLYFPGWQLKINGRGNNLQIKDGLMVFKVPPGNSDIELKFQETPIRMWGNLITLTAFIALLGYIIFLKSRKT